MTGRVCSFRLRRCGRRVLLSGSFWTAGQDDADRAGLRTNGERSPVVLGHCWAVLSCASCVHARMSACFVRAI